MTKDDIDKHISVLQKAAVSSDMPSDQLEYFEAAMALVRDAMVCLNIIAGRIGVR